MTGVVRSSMPEMLEYFNAQLQYYSGKEWPLATTWMKAFTRYRDIDEDMKKELVSLLD